MAKSQHKHNEDYVLFSSDPCVISPYLTRKQLFFNACSALVTKSHLPPIAASALIFFSFLQLLALIFATRLTNLNFILDILQNFRLFSLVESVGSRLFFYSTFILICIFVLGIALTIIMKYRHSLSPFLSYFANIVPLMYWVGILPITELLISLWECDENNEQVLTGATCWGIAHFIFLGVSCIIGIIWVLVLMMFTIVSGYSQPHKQDPFSHFPWMFEVFYTLLRVLFALNARVPALRPMELPLIGFTLLYFTSLLWNIYPYYNPTVSYSFAVSLLWNILGGAAAAVKLILDSFSVNPDGLVSFTIFCLIICPVFVNLNQKRWYKALATKETVSHFVEVDTRIHVLRNIYIEGFRYFPGQDSVLSMISYGLEMVNTDSKNSQKEETPASEETNLMEISTVASNKKKLLSLIARYNLNDKGNICFMFRMVGIYLHVTENVYMAYAILMEAEKQDPGILSQLDIYLQKIEIFAAIESQNNKMGRKYGYNNFKKVIQFEAEFENLTKKMLEQAEVRIDFWSNIKSRPSLNRLHTLGVHIMQINKTVKKSWAILNNLHPQHIPSLKLYKSYMKNLIGDREEVISLERRIQTATMERGWRALSLGELFSENSVIIVISASESRVIRASKSLARIFLYEPKELIGRNINAIMPPMIAQQHKRFTENFYRSNSSCTSGKQFQTFGLNRSGYIVPISLAVQPFFGFTLGMLYIGAITVEPQYNDEHYIIMDANGKIGGITRKLCKRLQLTPAIIAERKLSLRHLCPGMNAQKLNTLEGGITVKFLSTTEGLVTPSEKTPGSSRFNHSDNREVTCTAKCDLRTMKYQQDLVLKVLKVNKFIEEQEFSKKKTPNISNEIMQSVTTVLRAVRKFKALAMRAKMKKNGFLRQPLGHPRSKLSTGPIEDRSPSQFSFQALPSQRPEEEKIVTKETHEPLLSTKEAAPPKPSQNKNEAKQTRRDSQSKRRSLLKMLPTNLNHEQNPMIQEGSLGETYFKNLSLRPKSTKESSGSSKIYKEISEIRKKDIESFNPSSIMYLKIVTQLFITLVLALLSTRVGVSIWFNKKVVDFAPLMIANDNRLTATGTLGECVNILTMYFPLEIHDKPIMDEIVRYQRHDFSYLISKYSNSQNIVTYKDFILAQTRNAVKALKAAEQFIRHSAHKYSGEIIARINGEYLDLFYGMSQKQFSATVTIQDAIYTLIATSLELVEKFETGTYTYQDYEARMVVVNSLSNMVKGIRWTSDYIVEEAYNTIKVHEDFSLSTLITLLGLYAVYFIVLIPFLYLTNRDLVSMLMLFLDISRQDISLQHEKAAIFIRKVYRNEKVRSNEYSAGIGLNTEEDQLEEAENKDDNKGKVEEKSDDEEFNKKNEETKHKKRSHKSKKRSFIPYKSNVWKLLVLFGIFSGIIISIYIALDYFSKAITHTTAFKISELKALLRGIYASAHSTAYLYNLILSNKTGQCGTDTCVRYLPPHYKLRFEELYDLLGHHEGNRTLLSDSYNELFKNIFERNPCKTTALGKIADCDKLIGGVFTAGAHTTNVRQLDLSLSLYRDFMSCKGNIEDIIQYANDQRLIDIQVLNQQLLAPAFSMMIEYLKISLDDDLKYEVTLKGILFSVFVIGFLAISIGWLVWLTGFMQHTIYGTKALLSNLPDDVILRNEAIYRYLFNAHKGSEAIQHYFQYNVRCCALLI
eukprot:TRINITY_DN410_c0_g1_i1.p1 TRINITY_DN410_c0_g1~~TRINITY_DN410_c0_g1_i1.p1  ORF type:complete len:1730 (-),score=92.23 TRINITY_DN410_c0_g1_i1:13155-18188(-)